MRRRRFLALLAGAAAAAHPLPIRAQPVERMRRIGILVGPGKADVESDRRLTAFRDAMRALDWVEGKNLQIETRWGGGDPERIRAYAMELIQWAPDVIFANSTPVTAALKRGTTGIPIVFAIVADPVGDGFVASLSRPGGNITGFSSFDSEIGGKWIELLKEIAPSVTRAALLFNPKTAPGGGSAFIRPFFDAAARKLAIEPVAISVQDAAELERAVVAHAREPNAGLVAMPDSFVVVNSARVIRLAAEWRLPVVYPFRTFVTAGGLASYGVNTADLNRRAAAYVDRILRGAKPAELPVQIPTKFELAINLKTAKALGLAVPPTLVARADEVME